MEATVNLQYVKPAQEVGQQLGKIKFYPEVVMSAISEHNSTGLAFSDDFSFASQTIKHCPGVAGGIGASFFAYRGNNITNHIPNEVWLKNRTLAKKRVLFVCDTITAAEAHEIAKTLSNYGVKNIVFALAYGCQDQKLIIIK